MEFEYIIVSPYSPRWNNIASKRWSGISKYLSLKRKVTLLTSYHKIISEKQMDLGKARIIEIPIVMSFSKSSQNVSEKVNIHLKKILGKIKAEGRMILEKVLPFSAGGILLHDFKGYVNKISELIESSKSKKQILVTSYDPWFTLKIGNLIKRKYGSKIMWIADFRDPSFDVHESRISELGIFKYMTSKILKNADLVTVVSKYMVKEYEKLFEGDVVLVPNGHDVDLESLRIESDHFRKRPGFVRIVYTGSLHFGTVDISHFVKVLKRLSSRNPNIEYEFVYAGKDWDVVDQVFKNYGLRDKLVNLGLVSHEEALRIQRSADLLLLLAYTGDDERIGRQLRTGKVYEYFASLKPIIVIGPHSWEMKEEVESDGVSKLFHKSELEGMVEYVENLSFMESVPLKVNERLKIVRRYHYKSIAEEFDKIVSRKFEVMM